MLSNLWLYTASTSEGGAGRRVLFSQTEETVSFSSGRFGRAETLLRLCGQHSVEGQGEALPEKAPLTLPRSLLMHPTSVLALA